MQPVRDIFSVTYFYVIVKNSSVNKRNRYKDFAVLQFFRSELFAKSGTLGKANLKGRGHYKDLTFSDMYVLI